MSAAVAAAGRGLKRLVLAILAVAVLAAAYYGGGALLVHRIDDDPAFAAELRPPAGGSQLIATMAALIRREVDTHGWVANDPVVFPSHLLDDMAQFQTALITSLGAMAADLAARAGGDAAAELTAAVEALGRPGDLWTFDFRRSLRPQPTTERYYRAAADALVRFNAALARGDATLATDRDALVATVRGFADTVEAAATAGLRQVDERGGHWLDTTTDDRFQTTRGLIYARFLFLRALAGDHQAQLGGHDDARARALARLERVMRLGPWYVLNGRADGQWRPSHLAAQAAYALEASAALDALAAALARGDT